MGLQQLLKQPRIIVAMLGSLGTGLDENTEINIVMQNGIQRMMKVKMTARNVVVSLISSVRFLSARACFIMGPADLRHIGAPLPGNVVSCFFPIMLRDATLRGKSLLLSLSSPDDVVIDSPDGAHSSILLSSGLVVI